MPICANPVCKIARDNKCVEGLALKDCPFYGKPLQAQPSVASLPDATTGVSKTAQAPGVKTSVEEAEVAEEIRTEVKSLSLNAGTWLSVHGATEVVLANQSILLAIVGPTSAGKTSLVAALYQIFLRNTVKNYSFARSRTLYSFEQICHDTRAVSEAEKAMMRRTPYNSLPNNVGFYHLGLVQNSSGKLIDLLLADRTGEDYQAATSECSVVEKFSEIKRANCITILIDGDKFSDTAKRHNVKAEAELILQALCDSKCLTGKQQLAIVLTKLDLVFEKKSEVKTKAISDFEKFASNLEQRFEQAFCKTTSFQIAALPTTPVLDYAHGVENLLEGWCTKAVAHGILTHTGIDHLDSQGRAIENFCFQAEVPDGK
jgi:hypothetical protein